MNRVQNAKRLHHHAVPGWSPTPVLSGPKTTWLRNSECRYGRLRWYERNLVCMGVRAYKLVIESSV